MFFISALDKFLMICAQHCPRQTTKTVNFNKNNINKRLEDDLF